MDFWRLACALCMFLASVYILMSSAYCEMYVLGMFGLGMSDTYRMNSKGLSELP